MDRDATDYTIDEEARISGANWAAESFPLGDDDSVVPFNMSLVVVRANSACGTALRSAMADEEYQMRTLPAGCGIVGRHDFRVTEK